LLLSSPVAGGVEKKKETPGLKAIFQALQACSFDTVNVFQLISSICKLIIYHFHNKELACIFLSKILSTYPALYSGGNF